MNLSNNNWIKYLAYEAELAFVQIQLTAKSKQSKSHLFIKAFLYIALIEMKLDVLKLRGVRDLLTKLWNPAKQWKHGKFRFGFL